MKLSKLKFSVNYKILLVLAGIVCVIATAYLMVLYQLEVNEKDELEAEIALTREKIAAVPVEALAQQKADLNAQLTNAEAATAATRAEFGHEVNLISDVGRFYQLALACGVKIESVTSSDRAKGSVGGVADEYYPLGLTASGNRDQVNRFVDELSTEFPAVWLKNVDYKLSPRDATHQIPEVSAELNLNLNSFRGN